MSQSEQKKQINPAVEKLLEKGNELEEVPSGMESDIWGELNESIEKGDELDLDSDGSIDGGDRAASMPRVLPWRVARRRRVWGVRGCHRALRRRCWS